ncbi:hypothetical protein WJX82_000536 [Trebouxia sp. C0006]
MHVTELLRYVCSRRSLYRLYATVSLLSRLFVRLLSWVLEAGWASMPLCLRCLGSVFLVKPDTT